MKILVVNTGSSSFKYELVEMQSKDVLVRGNCERIGIDGFIKQTTNKGVEFSQQTEFKTHIDAFKKIVELLIDSKNGVIGKIEEIDAVGHRIVQMAGEFNDCVVLTEEIVEKLESLENLAPLHSAANCLAVRACWKVMGKNVKQVAVFDSIFHRTIPEEASLYALPFEISKKFNIRKFGFHGISHKYIGIKGSEILNKPINELKIVSCHLGGGSSVCAIDGGKSVETTMGFTPLDGVMMGTRCGSIDASCIAFLMEKLKMNADEVMEIVNKKSGLLGVSGISSDYRNIKKEADLGNERAILAIKMLAYHVRKNIAICVAAMDGIDLLVFTGGIGEHSKDLLIEIGKHLKFINSKISEERVNLAKRDEVSEIGSANSKVKIYIVPANEEKIIAQETFRVVKN